MREIISLYVGQAGIQMGQSCWELFCQEHGIRTTGELQTTESPTDSSSSLFTATLNPSTSSLFGISNQLDFEGVSTFFTHSPEGRIVPRALLIDTDPSVVEEVKLTSYGSLFPNDNIMTGKEDAANNWAKGANEMDGLGLAILDRLRSLCNQCSSVQGIFFFHSSGGGTGSGLGSALLQRIHDQYEKLPIFSFCAWPSPHLSTTVVEPYNTLLSIPSQLDASTISTVFDNEALYDICRSSLSVESPTYTNLNRLISQIVSSWTASLRFPGTLNLDMNEMATNLVPYPNLHFMLTSYAPIIKQKETIPRFTTDQLTSSVFRPDALFAKCDPTRGSYVACSLMYRGEFTPHEISNSIGRLKDNQDIKFVDWCPTGFKYGMNSRPPSVVKDSEIGKMNRSVCAMMNTTAIQEIFERLGDRFDAMFSKRAHLHWYICEGTETDDFEVARQRLTDLIDEYKLSESVQKDSPTQTRKEAVD